MALMRVVIATAVEHEVEGKTGLKVMENLRELDYGVQPSARHVLPAPPVTCTWIPSGRRGCRR